MAELFMECEEEELEPWQQKVKAIVVDDDDDDDEPIFVGEILSAKPASTYILNRVNPSSLRMGMQNGAPKRGAARPPSPGAVAAAASGFQSPARPAASTLAVQPQPRANSGSGTSQVLPRPLSGCASPQEAAKSSAGVAPPVSRSAASLARNLSIPVLAQSPSRPVAAVTAQPVSLNRVIPNNTSGLVFGLRQNLGVSQCQSGSAGNTTGLSKRPSTSEANSITPKKAKANETGSGGDSLVLPSVKSPSDTSSLQKGITPSNVKNGAPFPQACPKCNIHFNLLDPLKHHMKYCCPDMVHTFLGINPTDCSGTSTKIAETEKGKLIMLVNDFYYGKYEGNVQQVRQEQKTHTTFKCASCMKLLKNNIRFMNHMKHHLELEKQNSESWESHTTCQHCYRQFPTPFQLQCHIESTHTPHESSTICKICELSFETEQVLLQHMKDNHKPGEMPYVCQVCSYRSSSFSDVEKHFRAVHENTKNLLCPFCLKVIKIGAPYMHHYMRHQKKGVHRCTKCRLQFLTCKEKMDHKSQHHRTFKKPVQLEGLPPGTKVTIRASVGSLHPGSLTASSVSTSASTLQLPPNTKMTYTKNHTKLNASKAKPKLKPLSLQKKQSPGASSSSQNSNSGGGGGSNKRNNKIANTALNNLRCSEIQKCIECYSDIRTFASHFPAYVRCSLCRYSTSCSKAYVNHMMSFHSARQSKRFWIYKNHSEQLRGITVVCLNCDFLTDVSGLDKMATHLNESPAHTCQVVIENVSLDDLDAENLPDLVSNTLLHNESEENPQKISRPNTPEGQKETSASASLQTKDSAEETNKEHPANHTDEAPLAPECAENKFPSVLENSSSPELQACSKDPTESAGGGDAASLGNQTHEAPLAAMCEENKSPSVLERSSSPGLLDCSNDCTDSAEKGNIDSLGKQTDEAPSVACMEAASVLAVEGPTIPELNTCSKDSAGEDKDHLGKQGDGDPLAVQCEENKLPSLLGNISDPGLQTCSQNPMDSAEEGGADPLGKPGECKENKLVLESNQGSLAFLDEPTDFAEGGNLDSLEHETSESEESTSVPATGDASASEPHGCSKDSAEAATGDHLGRQADACGENTAVLAVDDSVSPGPQACSKEILPERTECEDSGKDDHIGGEEKLETAIVGEAESCPNSEEAVSENQTKVAELDEVRLEDMDTNNSNLTSEEDVSFEQFLRRRGEPDSASSDASEQGSVHLEPLTPSEVLEHEATEILQKGGVAPSAQKAGLGSEPASRGSSPSQVEEPVSQTEESEETS
ncbi:zinc finger protein 280D isoform X2 [Hemicordylus capensis]|uniref:zinc finger protein 280D isoform X2 n=1 Tax=Hemicordylus capensis TaxID=884348 RepID=UPI0023042237|nr:zinc finger protein 280D isoform X2 [Hemicordylus capensis]